MSNTNILEQASAVRALIELAETLLSNKNIDDEVKQAIENAIKPFEDQITISWHIDDIKFSRKSYNEDVDNTLTDKQAREVLSILSDEHDANDGICWDVIEVHTDKIVSSS